MSILTLDHLDAIHAQFDTPVGTRNTAGLRSALDRPANLDHYSGADLALQATSLIEGIATAHAYVDANKRTATAAGLVFLRVNGREISPTGQVDAVLDAGGPWLDEDALGAQVVALVTHALSASEFAAWLRERLTPQYEAASSALPDMRVTPSDALFEAALADVLQAHAATFAYLADR